jgi:DNA helicase-2/ATP-dependent DNA helicase PcrA
MKATKEQQAIIDHEQGRAVVFAVAGSGKTTTVVKRINRLIGECGHNPKRILATTFSRFARNQLEHKLADEEFCKGVEVATLHAVALRIVNFKTEQLEAPRKYNVDDNELSGCFYKAKDRIRDDNCINPKSHEVNKQLIEDLGYSDFANYLMQLKGDMLCTEWMYESLPERARPYFDIELFRHNQWLEVLIDTYEHERQSSRALGFDDIMVNATVSLGSNVALREQFSSRYEFVIVDEYQDVNKAQDLMLQFLDERSRNMMVIGDDDQTIYEWRGARPDFIRSKLSDSSWTEYRLSRNFRSSPGPVILAAQVIERNQNRAPKRMMPMMPFTGKLDIRRFHTIRDQAEEIALIAEAVYAETGSYDNVVILIRQYAETPCIEQVLIAKGIPYEIPDSKPFYFRRETGYILDYLMLLRLEHQRIHGASLDVNNREIYEKALRKVYTRPKTYMKRAALETIIEKAFGSDPTKPLGELLDEYNEKRREECGRRSEGVDDLIAFFTSYSNKNTEDYTAAKAISDLDSKTALRQWIVESSVHPRIGRVRAQIFDALIDYAEDDTLAVFLDQIETVKAFNATEIRGRCESKLKILTVFKSKGLEFPVVVVPNINSSQTDFPSATGETTSAREKRSAEEEERRIFYVAMTRAIHDLHIFYTSNEPSPYLTEADYKTVERYVAECKAVFKGELSALPSDTGKYFLENVLSYMHLFQVGNACARSWSRLLSSSDQEHIYLKVQQAIEDHLEISPLQSDQERKQASIRMKLWENINANAIRFRDERRDSPDDVDTRERFGPGTSGDIGVFSVVLEENETEFE